MVDFSKIIDHPEKTTIISKLCSGDSPKVVSNYLKDKYSKPDEGHLRLPINLLQEFLDSYANHHGFIKKVIQKNADSKLDKKIADSLMNTASWKERVAENFGKEINYLQRLDNILTILETRAEQIFDLIQEDPENTKTDYIFTKYLELLMLAIEKGDKIKNDKPDIRIEHTYTVQMVEQQSIAFQEAIRRVLDRMGPENAFLFMDLINEELAKINPKKLEVSSSPTPKQLEKEYKSVDKFEEKAQNFDQVVSAEFEEPEENDD
jgi:hypothetical protein